MQLALLLVLCFSAGCLAQFGSQCQWTDPITQTKFNLDPIHRSLAQGDYTGQSGKYSFVMNVCGVSNFGGNCTSQGATICQYENGVFESAVAHFSTDPQWVISTLDGNPNKGVKITYANGDVCFATGLPRHAVVQLQCDPSAPLPTKFAITEDDAKACDYHITMTHPSACPIPSNIDILRPEVVVVVDSAQGLGVWRYWQISVTDNHFELNVETKQSGLLVGWAELFVRYGALPTASAFDYRDSTNSLRHNLIIRRDSDIHLVTGTYYIGVLPYNGAITYQLLGHLFDCPGAYGKVCSGQGTCDQHTCSCNAQYVTDFNDCSAKIVPLAIGATTIQTSQDDETRYFRFEINDLNAFQLFVEVDRMPEDSQRTLPLIMIQDNDFPTYENNLAMAQDWFTPSQHWELALHQSQLSQGVWNIAVKGSNDFNFTYSVQINLYDCPRGCSGHGECIAANHTCNCYANYAGTIDCSLYQQNLKAGIPIHPIIKPYEMDYFDAFINQTMAQAHVDMLLTINVSDYHHPRVFVAPNSFPTSTEYYIASALPLTEITQVRIPAAALNAYGAQHWYVGIQSFAPTDMEVTIRMDYEGYCPNDCSGNGVCNINKDYSVSCSCKSGYIGAGCDLKSSGSSGASDSLVAGLCFLFLFIGLVVGVLVKRKFPSLCAGKQQSLAEQSYGETDA